MKTAFPKFPNVVTIRLYSNIPFDNTYKHHCLISEKFKYNNTNVYNSLPARGLACERFLNRRDYTTTPSSYYYPRYDLTGSYNFNFSNGLVASVVLELTPEQTNANYLRVEVGDAINGYDYYYYFVTSITQINVDTYNLQLELDVLMTYQDEFIDGMKDVPVFTKRKHCHRYTDNGLYPHSSDFKTGDETFANTKPTIIKKITHLDYNNSNLKKIKGVKWLYICCDALRGQSGDTTIRYFDSVYTAKDVKYPMSILVFPLNVSKLIIKNQAGTTTYTYTTGFAKVLTDYLVNNGVIHGTKISDYPPFISGTCDLTNNELTITADGDFSVFGGSSELRSFTLGNNTFVLGTALANTNLDDFISRGALIITQQNSLLYASEEIVINENFKNANAPTTSSNRYTDPKLFFAPFTKYMLTAKYSSDGCEFYPELLFSEYVITSEYKQRFDMYASAYIADNNFYCFPTQKAILVGSVYEYAFQYYQYAKIGLASVVNYSVPAGENALDVFNATQAQAFYQSKTASGITSGLTIAGGIASIAGGIVLSATGSGAPLGFGLIAGGAGAVTSGIAGIANTVKSQNAKIEDLKNTPDSINISGSNYLIDEVISASHPLPYLLRYECTDVIKENANDFFYNYGYAVARECYFNTELKYTDASHKVDNDLFGRCIFNYIELNDDITNKINANIPQIIKQKLSNIFNNGITIWNFFDNGSLWGNDSVSATNTPDKWFMKCNLDNTECNLVLN